MQIEFTLMNGQLNILDAVRAPRSARAAVAGSVVKLAQDDVISRGEALLRIPPFQQAIAAPSSRCRGPARCVGPRDCRSTGRGNRQDCVFLHRRAGLGRAGEATILVKRGENQLRGCARDARRASH